ncbi:uncharacterized protein (TIGR02001 family) [Rhodoblastus acidophilus]|uniref:TorF family putative porin n=1 Tax=Rhodoblastus acidophilus TaxID=1074 RepID=UPI0022255FE2|nr:TorF family putative porin [Rhodoblastus acidophilus]MCW2283289.1 uncharacterized protein (TIGR02001 family) [Rhodoblastus acidophilus]MCW2332149.1 uncharacterized protein (TIGR02001 family) [Rhodoblastus acidophilus]
MNKISIAAAVLAISAGSAFAGDLPSSKSAPIAPVVTVSPWDFDIGATLTSDYLFRGLTQSNHQPSLWGRAELRYNVNPNWQFYIGTSAESIKFTNNAFPVGSPAVEIDGSGGVRGTFDKFAFDFGAIGYGYPDSPTGTQTILLGPTLTPTTIGLSPRNPTFFELYFKPTYTVNDWLTVGLNEFYTPSYLNTGAYGNYLSGTVKLSGQGDLSAFAVSGEFGRQWLGTVDNVYSGNNPANYTYIGYANGQLPSYNYWNAGVSYTWKFATLDLRYYGTSLSPSQAYILTGIPNASYVAGGSTVYTQTSAYANQRFVATLSFDLTSKDLK